MAVTEGVRVHIRKHRATPAVGPAGGTLRANEEAVRDFLTGLLRHSAMVTMVALAIWPAAEGEESADADSVDAVELAGTPSHAVAADAGVPRAKVLTVQRGHEPPFQQDDADEFDDLDELDTMDW